ncbi:hypothetical protein [Peptoanaerobacter stomatis]|uniref:hypothetical protein n=1 Tax=Peptoanaerobacter stomatis TaxID=796937 RepID=UPI003FA14FF5
MYKLQYMNIIVETNDEMTKNVLISEGYELMEDIKDDEETAEDETAQEEDKTNDETDISEEKAEDNTDETENKAGKKSGKAKK